MKPNNTQARLTVEGPDLRAEIAHGIPVVLVDVRSPREFREVHIPGAVNVPLDLLPQVASELVRLTFGRPVVVVCRTDRRAESARASLAGIGGADVRVLQGGMVQWIDDGGPVEWPQRPRGC